MSLRTVLSVGTDVTRQFCFPIIFLEVTENNRKNEKIVFVIYTGRLARRTTLESDRKEIGFSVLYSETFKPWLACYKITVACLRRHKIWFFSRLASFYFESPMSRPSRGFPCNTRLSDTVWIVTETAFSIVMIHRSQIHNENTPLAIHACPNVENSRHFIMQISTVSTSIHGWQ